MPGEEKTSEIRHALGVQKNIGWRQFWTGKLGVPWVMIQQKYFETQERRNTGVRWGAKVVKSAWAIIWKYWGVRSNWTHSTSSLWYLSACLQLQTEITAEYRRGPERCCGLTSRSWKRPLAKILATNVVDKKKVAICQVTQELRESTRQGV